MMKNKKIKFAILFIVSIIVGYLVGFLYNNYRLIRNKDNIGLNDIPMENIKLDGFRIEDNKLISENNNPKILMENFNFQYLKKLKFNYSTTENFEWTINENYANVYGFEESTNSSGHNNKNINIFVENLSKNINKLEISFTLNDTLEVSNIMIDNSIIYMALNYSYFILGAITIFLCIYFRKSLKNYVEYLFLILSLFFGTVLIINTQIACGKSWDEQIHYDYTYGLVNTYFTKAAYELSDIDLQFVKNAFSYFNTDEEKIAFSEHLNNVNNQSTPYRTNVKFSSNKVSYLPASLAFFLGDLFKFPFNLTYIGALFINLFVYVGIVFLAIRKTPIGKYLMLVIGLIPTTLFMACSFSYDPPITAFVLLGLAYYLYEMKNKDKKLTMSSALIMATSFTLGTMAKPVYAFLLLLFFTLPKDKFKSSKKQKQFLLITVVILLMTLFLIIMPVLAHVDVSDARGGDTNATLQVLTILKSPVSFIRVFLDNAGLTFLTKLISPATLLSFGYFGQINENATNIYYLFLALLFSSLFIKNENILDKKTKIILAILIMLSIGCIWGSLYVSFTPVGSVTINGVQNRYFIPLIMPLLLLLATNNVKVKLDDKKIYAIYAVILFIVISMTLFYKFI